MTETQDFTLQQFEELVGQSYDTAAEIEKVEREVLKPLRARLDAQDATIIETLAKMDMNSFKCRHGQIIRSTRYSVQTPKTIEDKVAFFEWLNKEKGRDVYWSYCGINSQSLNAFYKAEMEVAKEAGDLDFKIPGIGEPTASQTLSRRKK